jgi:hypothetical protein
MSQSDFSIALGAILDTDRAGSNTAPDSRGPRRFSLSERQWSTHCAIVGPTGAGKSRMMWQMMREHRRQRRGFCCIDPGDLAADFLADCAAEILLGNNHALLKKLFWIKLNPLQMARYDPWKCVLPEGLHPEVRRGVEVCWRHKRVQQFMQVFQANVTGSTDFMNQPRRQRVMTNAFTALATAVEEKHLAIEDVFIFFDPAHKDHRRVLDRCVPHLPPEIRRELEMLGGFKRLGDLWQQIESSVNSLRALLGPCMKAMLSATGQEPSFDWNEAVQRGGYVIVDAQQGFAGHSENVALATLVALDLGETMLNTPRAKRKKFTLFVDEAAEFLGPLGNEFGHWLRIMRKYGMPCVLAFQDLASMRKGELDLAPMILGQCGTIICFRSRWYSDNEILARILLTGNLQFVPLMHDAYQQRGEHKWIRVEEKSRSDKQDETRSTARGTTTSTGNTHTTSDARSEQSNTARGSSESKVYGPTGLTASVSKGTTANGGTSQGNSSTVADAATRTNGTSETTTTGTSNGWAVTVGEKHIPLPVIVHSQEKTGQLEDSVADQFEKGRQHLHGLDDRHAIVLAPGMKKAIEIRTEDVADPFQSPEAQAKAVRWIENKICETHDFYFTPSFDPQHQDARVEQFVTAKKDTEDESPSPMSANELGRRDPLRTKAPLEKEIPFGE